MTNPTKIILIFLSAAVVGGLVGAVVFQFRDQDDTTPVVSTSPTTKSATSSTNTTATKSTTTTTTSTTTSPTTSSVNMIAFFYQTVGQFKNGVGENAVAAGYTTDGKTVSSYGQNMINFIVSKGVTDVYGDPVISRLSNGRWAMTAWTGQQDTRGAGFLLYHESECPLVNDEDVIAIGPSSASGCRNMGRITGGKSSQVFEGPDGNYVFHMIGGALYLAHLSDATNSAMDLDSMCVLDTQATNISNLGYGESTLVLNPDELLLSDSAIAKRKDGTWVLFVKGIEKSVGCSGGSICELCARNVYRTTSTDLINWSDLEVVVEQASVPEAVTMPDGTVWLYFQDFDNTCEAQNLQLGGIAPISAQVEQAGTNEMSDPIQVTFPDEAFQTNEKIHYATNGNPVSIPDAAAFADYEACLK